VPKRDWHTRKCKHNLDAYNFLNSATKDFLDWKIVMLFYSVVHDVDAFFDTLPLPPFEKHPKEHKYRRKLVSRYLGIIAQEYHNLDQLSRWARYDNVPITQPLVNGACNFFSVIHSYLNPP